MSRMRRFIELMDRVNDLSRDGENRNIYSAVIGTLLMLLVLWGLMSYYGIEW